MKVAALFVGLFRFPKWGMSRPLAVRIMSEAERGPRPLGAVSAGENRGPVEVQHSRL